MKKSENQLAKPSYPMFEAYGSLADNIESPILVAGRNRSHEDQLLFTIADAKHKLNPQPQERLLEIGCNIGLLLNPLAELVAEAVGIDHEKLIDKYKMLGHAKNITLVKGSWPDTPVDGEFDCIIVYGVLHCMPSAELALGFIEACYSVLRPGGRMLIGDVPNEDIRDRFLKSASGQALAKNYEKIREKEMNEPDGEFKKRKELLAPAVEAPYMDDEFTLSALRSARYAGLNAFALPQPETLPLCYSREDILIVKPR